jgi:hypothetical protein
MAWTAIGEGAAGSQAIAETSTTKRHPLGTILRGVDPTFGGGEFIYLLGVVNTLAGHLVTYAPSTYLTALSPNTAAIGNPLAVAMSANVASQYGWYQIQGIATVLKTAVRVLLDVRVFQSATTGRLMATVATGKEILNARSANLATVTSTLSTVLVSINRPFAQGQII